MFTLNGDVGTNYKVIVAIDSDRWFCFTREDKTSGCGWVISL